MASPGLSTWVTSAVLVKPSAGLRATGISSAPLRLIVPAACEVPVAVATLLTTFNVSTSAWVTPRVVPVQTTSAPAPPNTTVCPGARSTLGQARPSVGSLTLTSSSVTLPVLLTVKR
ncbi:hypothetical protein D3C71_1196460 [compost metagenome]